MQQNFLLHLKETSIRAINLVKDGLLVCEKFNPNSKALFCWVVKLWEERLTMKLSGGCLLTIFWNGFCFFNNIEIFFIQTLLVSKNFEIHLSEHLHCVTKQEIHKSLVSKHCWSAEHNFNCHQAKIISKPNWISELYFLENIAIHQNLEVISDLIITPV